MNNENERYGLPMVATIPLPDGREMLVLDRGGEFVSCYGSPDTVCWDSGNYFRYISGKAGSRTVAMVKACNDALVRASRYGALDADALKYARRTGTRS